MVSREHQAGGAAPRGEDAGERRPWTREAETVQGHQQATLQIQQGPLEIQEPLPCQLLDGPQQCRAS